MNKGHPINISEKEAFNLKGKKFLFELIEPLNIHGEKKIATKGVVLGHNELKISFEDTPIDFLIVFSVQYGKLNIKASNIKKITNEK